MTTMKNSGQRPEHRYSAGMTSSPLPPDQIRAAAAGHHELGPEYSDGVIESFLEKIDQEIAAHIERQLASLPQERLRQPEPARLAKARTLLAARRPERSPQGSHSPFWHGTISAASVRMAS